ncbi:hypothetical protein [uncultured Granulicatella sp.]|uniref:hypothetical protein n=1 Tax=uncultured Granulicatella sp. TaxID=316089 RepID=UPI0028D0C37A|nr:hypothetical protein [uncultured Granulicatella sp.]
MGRKTKYKISDYVFNQLLELDYDALVKVYVALAITEEEGLTDVIRERWGRGKDKKQYLVIPVSRTLKEGEPNGKIPEEILRHIKIHLS